MNPTILLKEWTILYRMVKLEDTTLSTLHRLCKENNVDYKRCYKHYRVIYKMPYQKAKKFIIFMMERYITKEISFPPVPPLEVSPSYNYEKEAIEILIFMKYM